MPSLDDIYRKFGQASEAAQLLETELGTHAFMNAITEKNLIDVPNTELAAELLRKINHQTLGALVKRMIGPPESVDRLHTLLSQALRERNRLSHSFYRQHNLRRDSEQGRILMMTDLESIHKIILEAYMVVLSVLNQEIELMDVEKFEGQHLPIE